MMRRGLGLSIALFLALRARDASAQDANTPDALGASLAEGLDAPLSATTPETWGDRESVAVRVISRDGASPESVDALSRSLVRALSTRRRAVALTSGDDLAGAVRAAREAHTPRLLRVEVSTAQGVTRASASLIVVDPGPWSTFLASSAPEPTTVATLERSATTAVTAPPPTATWPAPGRPRLVATPFRATVALSANDLDGDGRDELVIVTADRVRVARMNGASLAFTREAGGAALPRAPVPLRQPLGSADRDAARRIVRYRTSQLSTMAEVSLAGDVARARSLGVDLYPAPGFGCVALRGGSHLVASMTATCDATSAPVSGAVAAVPVAFDEAAGSAHVRWEARTNGDGRAEIRRDGAPFATLDDAASPASLDDLDGDGRPELVLASASAPGSPDRVRVFSLTARPEERASIAVPGTVEAITVGDLDGDHRRELIVSVFDPSRRASTLWIVP